MSIEGNRLDSWKAIAQYLERNERTVQRWELDRALPVHRLPGAKRGGVFAYATELDMWMAKEPEQEAGESGDIGSPARNSFNIAAVDAGSEQTHVELDRRPRLQPAILRAFRGRPVLRLRGGALIVFSGHGCEACKPACWASNRLKRFSFRCVPKAQSLSRDFLKRSQPYN